MAFIGVPVSGTLIALWAMRDYELDEAAVRDIKTALLERRAPSQKPEDADTATLSPELALQS
jgi:GPH family glycoside/pentoside/hexuronide:cation symporter